MRTSSRPAPAGYCPRIVVTQPWRQAVREYFHAAVRSPLTGYEERRPQPERRVKPGPCRDTGLYPGGPDRETLRRKSDWLVAEFVAALRRVVTNLGCAAGTNRFQSVTRIVLRAPRQGGPKEGLERRGSVLFYVVAPRQCMAPRRDDTMRALYDHLGAAWRRLGRDA